MTATVRAPKISEKAVTQACIQWLRLNGWTCIRLQSALVDLPGNRKMRVGVKGLPDWVAVKQAAAFFLELKAPGRKPSIDQEIWMEMARERKHRVMWADGFEVFIERFRTLWGQ
jgi:hypothetical protein